MIAPVTLWLPEAKKTHSAGVSLASSLYAFPVDILLSGELGAGKTTFLQGFGEALGISDRLVSPTYALEQHYRTTSGIPVIHLDLYRLKPEQARELLAATDDHEGIRCIEWPSRSSHIASGKRIMLDFAEEKNGRMLAVTFDDMPLPSIADIQAWYSDMKLPANIIAHCATVAKIAGTCAEDLLKRGHIVRTEAVHRAALVHDLLRFLDFKPGGAPADISISKDAAAHWETLRAEYPGMRHEAACAEFLERRGYSELAQIVAVHGVMLPNPERTTIEQKLLYYADKRAQNDKIVSIDERFHDFISRYGHGTISEQAKHWCDEARLIERELFPDGAPL